MFNKRQDDLLVVFNKTWKANHNDDIKKAKEKEAEFNKKMFGDNNLKMNNDNSFQGKLNSLNNNINIATEGQRKNNINNIIKKWK